MSDYVLTENAASVGMSPDRLAQIPKYFEGYLERKKFSGLQLLLARKGKVVLRSCQGVKDWDTNDPIGEDTIYRIYSMSKPITSVALMMLYERGLFRLEHEVSRYLPEFADMQVYKTGDVATMQTEPARNPMQIKHLLTHTSGLTYDFLQMHPVDRLYRKRGLEGLRMNTHTLAEFSQELGKMPLVFEPGTRWNYSFGTDICGRLVEVLSGQSLDAFFEEHIFRPLEMVDTAFLVPQDKASRFASCYDYYRPDLGVQKQDDPKDSTYITGRKLLSGGGGLVSTTDDYYRFCQMLINGGILDGKRLLSPTTVDYMSKNHLPGNRTMAEMGDEMFSENNMSGSGFGLGFSMILDDVEAMSPVSTNAYSWGGAASTYFWIDPMQDLIGILMTQVMPSDRFPIRPQFQQLAYAAIVD